LLYSTEFLFLIQNHNNKVVLLLRIQKKNLYISSLHVEKCSDLITLTNQFISLVTAMTNARCILRFESILFSYSQEWSLVTFKGRRITRLYMDLSRRILLWFILFNMGFQKFIHRHEKHALNFGNPIFWFKTPRIKSCY
jgi:hypothetical protein